MKNKATTTEPMTTNHNIGRYTVCISSKDEGSNPHAFEIATDETNNSSEYYAEGSLEIDQNKIVTGYDGCYSLPLAVAIVLAKLGFGFAPFVFPEEKVESLLTK